MSTVQARLNKCDYMQASYVHESPERAYLVSVWYRLALQEKTEPGWFLELASWQLKINQIQNVI